MGELSKLIPEIYYDIIGRIIPGLVGLVLWSYALNVNAITLVLSLYAGSSALSGSTLLFAVTILAVAYAIGHLVSPISAAVHSRLLPRFFPASFRVLKDAVATGKNAYPGKIGAFFQAETSALFGIEDRQPSAAEYRRVTFLWYDWVRLRNPTAGTRLAKMRAEYRMLEGLYVVFGVTLLLSSISFFLRFLEVGIQPPSASLVIADAIWLPIATWAAARLFRTYQFSVINHYYQLRTMTPGEAGEPAAREKEADRHVLI